MTNYGLWNACSTHARIFNFMKRHILIAVSLCFLIAACSGGGGGSSSQLVGGNDPANDPGSDPSNDPAGGSAESLIGPAATCVIEDERRQVGMGLDAPGRLEVDRPPVAAVTGPCAGNQQFQIGAALHDITGMIADTASLAWVNPQQVFSALHSRVYARAFAVASPCNGRRVMFVSIDTGLMSAALRQAVLAEIAADPELSENYDARNVMLSVTHTHSDPGAGLAGIGNGFAILARGIFAAIRDAHANLAAHPQPGSLRLSSGELLNTNINRSKPAFALNPVVERQQFLNQCGEEVQVDKRMVQLELTRADGNPTGLINWFGVHPTVIGPTQSFVSGDVKGHASLGFERLMNTDYRADPADDNFVAAFAQGVEGDSSPNIFIEQFPHPDPRRGGGENDLDSNAISGVKQLARALELFGSGPAVTGPVDFRLLRVNIENITVEDPAVLASLSHPPELDDNIKRTCSGILGASFGAGAEDGPGPATEGLKCSDDPALLDDALTDIATLTGTRLEGFPGGWPAETIPGQVLSSVVMCNAQDLPPVLGDFSCQAEKPVLLPRGSAVIPLQLFRIGQLALLGVPWEVTTMSARRIQQLMLEELAPVGVETLVIAGLVNDYVHYLATREEYAAQHYEGASTLYGPWTQAAVAQESLKLARALRTGEELQDAPATAARSDLEFVAGPNETPHPAGAPGTVISQPPATVQPGETLRAEFVVGHPGNDLRLQESYITVEREAADGQWVSVVEDRDPNLLYIWKPLVSPPVAVERPLLSSGGSGEIIWDVPGNMPAGLYRLRVEGRSRGLLAAEAEQYQALSNPFEIDESTADCP